MKTVGRLFHKMGEVKFYPGYLRKKKVSIQDQS